MNSVDRFEKVSPCIKGFYTGLNNANYKPNAVSLKKSSEKSRAIYRSEERFSEF